MKREKNSGTGRGGVDQSTSRSASTRSSAVTALQSMAGDPIPHEASGHRTLASGQGGGQADGWRRVSAGGVVVRERVSSTWVRHLRFGDFFGEACRVRGEERRGQDSRDALCLLGCAAAAVSLSVLEFGLGKAR